MVTASYIHLPHYTHCDNDTPEFRDCMHKYHDRVLHTIDRFESIQPLVKEIVKNLDDLTRNCQKFDEEIRNLRAPIFYFNAAPPTSPSSGVSSASGNSLHAQARLSPQTSPESGSGAVPTLNRTDSQKRRSRHTTKTQNTDFFLKENLTDGMAGYLECFIDAVKIFKNNLNGFDEKLGKTANDHRMEKQKGFEDMLKLRKDFYNQLEKFLNVKKSKEKHQQALECNQTEDKYRESRYKCLQQCTSFYEKFKNDVSLVLFLGTQSMQSFYAQIRDDGRTDRFYTAFRTVIRNVDSQTEAILATHEAQTKDWITNSNKFAVIAGENGEDTNDFVSRLFLYTPKRGMRLPGAKRNGSDKGLKMGSLLPSGGNSSALNPLARTHQRVIAVYNRQYNTLRLYSGEDKDYVPKKHPWGEVIVGMNQVNGCQDKCNEYDRYYVLSLRQKSIINKELTQTKSDDVYDEILLQAKSYAEFNHWKHIFEKNSKDVKSLKPFKMGHNSIKFLKLAIDRLEVNEENLLDTLGLYRVSGRQFEVEMLVSAVRDNASDQIIKESLGKAAANGICSSIKLFLQKVKPSLFTDELYRYFIEAFHPDDDDEEDDSHSDSTESDPAKILQNLLNLCKKLPPANKHTLVLLLQHWNNVCANSSQNKMTPMNIAICVAPSLLRHSESNSSDPNQLTEVRTAGQVIEFLIRNNDAVKRALFPELTSTSAYEVWKSELMKPEYASKLIDTKVALRSVAGRGHAKNTTVVQRLNARFHGHGRHPPTEKPLVQHVKVSPARSPQPPPKIRGNRLDSEPARPQEIKRGESFHGVRDRVRQYDSRDSSADGRVSKQPEERPRGATDVEVIHM